MYKLVQDFSLALMRRLGFVTLYLDASWSREKLRKKILLNKTYLDQKVPGIHSESSKYKFYSKVILSSSKYSPSTATHLCQRLIQLSKHFWNAIVGIIIRAVFDFFIISFRLLKRVPRNDFLTRSNRKKSQGAISDEFEPFDGC